MHFTELDTPALCVDLDVLEKNIRDLQTACDQLEIGLRVPHQDPQDAGHCPPANRRRSHWHRQPEVRRGRGYGRRGHPRHLIPYNIVGQPS